MIIGLVGTSGSGKSSAAKYLKNKGFYLVKLSSYLKKEAQKMGIDNISKKVLQDIGNSLRNKYGPQVLAEMAFSEMRRKKAKKAVIDGIRNFGEIGFLEDKKDFYLLGITAPEALRYQRIVSLHGRDYIGSFSNFLKIERRDSRLGSGEAGLRTKDCLKKALYIIKNDSKVKDFYHQIDVFIQKISR